MGLPDELWAKLIVGGIENATLDYRDVCVLSMVCHQLRRLSGLDHVWKLLWQQEDGSSNAAALEGDGDWKMRYRRRFEKLKSSKMVAHRRRVLRTESQIFVLNKECMDLRQQIQNEQKKLATAIAEFSRSDHARQASIGLQMWQPQLVRTQQQQMVQQQPSNLEAHRHSLDMEIKVCKEQIERFRKSLGHKKAMLNKAEGELESLSYNPIQTESKSEARKRKRKSTVRAGAESPCFMASQFPDSSNLPLMKFN